MRHPRPPLQCQGLDEPLIWTDRWTCLQSRWHLISAAWFRGVLVRPGGCQPRQGSPGTHGCLGTNAGLDMTGGPAGRAYALVPFCAEVWMALTVVLARCSGPTGCDRPHPQHRMPRVVPCASRQAPWVCVLTPVAAPGTALRGVWIRSTQVSAENVTLCEWLAIRRGRHQSNEFRVRHRNHRVAPSSIPN
jgi:hypothetical protein